MRVFVLCTGRCGSNTLERACSHITNYTSSVETQVQRLGAARLEYPDNHIEVDNRLSWYPGRLEERYGDDPFYVHLKRNVNDTSRSLAKRYRRHKSGIVKAYWEGILQEKNERHNPVAVSLDYCETVNKNIELLLKGKPRKMTFNLETAEEDFETFWREIGAEGDLQSALREWSIRHNKTAADPEHSVLARMGKKLGRIARKLPGFVRSA